MVVFVAAAVAAAVAVRSRTDGLTAVASALGVVVFASWFVHAAIDWLWQLPALAGDGDRGARPRGIDSPARRRVGDGAGDARAEGGRRRGRDRRLADVRVPVARGARRRVRTGVLEVCSPMPPTPRSLARAGSTR